MGIGTETKTGTSEKQEATEITQSVDLLGAPDRSRTCNLLIRSQVLYPLSYGRIRCVIKNYSESVNEAESAHFNIK